MLVASLVVDQGNQILVSLDLLELLFASVDTSLSLGSETGKAVLMRSVTMLLSFLLQELTLVMTVHNVDGLLHERSLPLERRWHVS
jgi:hypothetical protein